MPATGVNSLEPAQVRPRTPSHNQASANLQDILSGQEPSDFTTSHAGPTAPSLPPNRYQHPSLALNTSGNMGSCDALSNTMSHGQSSANPPLSPDDPDSDNSPVCLGSRPVSSSRPPMGVSGHHRPSLSTVDMNTQHHGQDHNRSAFYPANVTEQRSNTGNHSLAPRHYNESHYQAVTTMEATTTYSGTVPSSPYSNPYGEQRLYTTRVIPLTSPYEQPISPYDTEGNLLPQNLRYGHPPDYATGSEQAYANAPPLYQTHENSHHHHSQAQQPSERSRTSEYKSELTQASRGGRQWPRPASYQPRYHHYGAAQQQQQSQFQPLGVSEQQRFLTCGGHNPLTRPQAPPPGTGRRGSVSQGSWRSASPDMAEKERRRAFS